VIFVTFVIQTHRNLGALGVLVVQTVESSASWR
jgi:hypothetical protein